MEHIHWYPGHIAKAEKKLKEQVNIVDVVIEVLDARIPMSSSYPDIEKLLKDKLKENTYAFIAPIEGNWYFVQYN